MDPALTETWQAGWSETEPVCVAEQEIDSRDGEQKRVSLMNSMYDWVEQRCVGYSRSRADSKAELDEGDASGEKLVRCVDTGGNSGKYEVCRTGSRQVGERKKGEEGEKERESTVQSKQEENRNTHLGCEVNRRVHQLTIGLQYVSWELYSTFCTVSTRQDAQRLPRYHRNRCLVILTPLSTMA
ncbi:hypothetical protein BO82DRAFT_366385 [Aspergillus uvarum CBS 121591]|uniref:Uncharacterized protein n=1 Tax=Aspergillus uvarum CBS 121591 TaxID=1448315 RepID=A0A319C7U2_9EURO|nr:hypothetical protein BO82DRAFT_366385 [Aspergillus uvarum CBS 121591]PYH79949.1 hypothetical protein BO82DRAFT_366385 [Aspergillus uvarum CBS 121591]